jgi:hypothetical protein
MITSADMGTVWAIDHVSTAIRDRILAGQGSTARRQPREPVALPRGYHVRIRALLRLPARKEALTQ